MYSLMSILSMRVRLSGLVDHEMMRETIGYTSRIASGVEAACSVSEYAYVRDFK